MEGAVAPDCTFPDFTRPPCAPLRPRNGACGPASRGVYKGPDYCAGHAIAAAATPCQRILSTGKRSGHSCSRPMPCTLRGHNVPNAPLLADSVCPHVLTGGVVRVSGAAMTFHAISVATGLRWPRPRPRRPPQRPRSSPPPPRRGPRPRRVPWGPPRRRQRPSSAPRPGSRGATTCWTQVLLSPPSLLRRGCCRVAQPRLFLISAGANLQAPHSMLQPWAPMDTGSEAHPLDAGCPSLSNLLRLVLGWPWVAVAAST